MKYNKIVMGGLLLAILVLVSNGLAFSVTILPASESTTNIENKDCGKNTATSLTFTNGGGGGVLCWYWTNENPTRTKLTTSCVDPYSTSSFNAHLSMPSSGSKTVTVQFECYDFYDVVFGKDKCNDSYNYDEAVAHKYSKGNIGNRYYALSCSETKVTIAPSESSVSLSSGDSRNVDISVNNLGENAVVCSYSGQSIGSISSGGTQIFSVSIKAPSSGSGTTSQSISIKCIDSETKKQVEKATTISVTYSPNPCFAKIEAALSVYNNAASGITAANQVIQSAGSRCEGTDTAEAIIQKNQAESYLSNARSSYENARTFCSNGDKDNAISRADDAINKAEQAINYVTQTKNAVERAVADCLSGRKEASDVLKQADSNIRSAESWIERAQSVVKNGTDLGMDTHQEKADVETAKSVILNAKTYYRQASSYFDSKDYSMTKKDANEAITKTKDAEDSAKRAYNSLYKTVEDAGTAKTEMNTAATEIAQADQIFSKLAVVVRNLKQNTNMSEIEAEISELRSKIESARDYSSQAQNKFSAGYFSESVDLATSARDTAATANNRLSRLLEGLTITVTDSLDKTAGTASAKITEANLKINEASSTYAANGDEIASARKSIQQSNTALQEANTLISKAKKTEDLSEFLTVSSDAFTKLESVDTGVETAKTHAQNAINLGYATIGLGAAAVVSAGGVGFLFWRRKKDKTKKDEGTSHDPEKRRKVSVSIMNREMATKVKSTDEAKGETTQEKGVLECPKCRVVKTQGKFCQECGRPLRKKPKDVCPVCESKISLDDKFCKSCGTKLKAD